MLKRVMISLLLTGIGLGLVLAFFIGFVVNDPLVILCVSPFAFPLIFLVSYLFLAPTFPSVYRAMGKDALSNREQDELEAQLQPILERGEQIVSVVIGSLSSTPAAMTLSNRRLIISYAGDVFAFSPREIEWLRWSPLASKLKLRLREKTKTLSLDVSGAHWKIAAEQLASDAYTRFGVPART